MSAARRVGTAEQTPAEVEAAEKFIADLIARGEAVEVDRVPSGSADKQNDAPEEPLPAGVTHEVVHRDGETVVKRRRYSAF
ncbi:hypothetical protein [Cryptosporangium sp. NPDC048952]|uniref:hypothetical protein n=1 Tax=Cryptosporangium sp. NPDC048952 TaxID=3363961 RepID=UPI00371A41C7